MRKIINTVIYPGDSKPLTDAIDRAKKAGVAIEINPEWKALESSGLPYWESDSTGKINPFPANPPQP